MKQNNSKAWYNKISENIVIVACRFPLAILFIVVSCVLSILLINDIGRGIDKWLIGTLLSMIWSVFLYLLTENRISKKLANLIVLIGTSGTILLTQQWGDTIETAEIIQALLLFLSFGVGLFFAPFSSKKTSSNHFWLYANETGIQLITTLLFTTILLLGLSLSYVSLSVLFGIDLNSKYYSNLFVFCYVLFFPIYFLSNITTAEKIARRTAFYYPKILKVLGLYILLPILLTYLVILYIYLFKIIFQWQLPDGWVSILVSILSTVGLFILILLQPLRKSNKLVVRFTRWFPIVLLPLLALMLIGIVRRIADYGITMNRILVLCFNLWLWAVSIYLIITHNKRPKWILISLCILSFISAFSVPIYTRLNLTAQLSQLLQKAHFGTEKTPHDLSREEELKILEISDYIASNFGKQPIENLTEKLGKRCEPSKMLTRLQIDRPKQQQTYQYYRLNQKYAQSIGTEIRGYQLFIPFHINDTKKVETKNIVIEIVKDSIVIREINKNNEVSISLTNKIELFQKKSDTLQPIEDMVFEQNDYKLVIKSIDIQVIKKERENRNSYNIENLSGYLFVK